MIALLQRVTEATVVVNEKLPGEETSTDHCIGRIGHGTLALVGVENNDGRPQVERLLQRILAWRMFSDDRDRMNLDIGQVDGGLLLVPQFTLAADTNSGNRPSFSSAASPVQGKQMFELMVGLARRQHPLVETGRFGADMKVSLLNDGPVTFWLRVAPET